MKKLLLTLLFVTFILIGYSQTIKSTISDEFRSSINTVNAIKTENGYISYFEIGTKDHLKYGFGWNKVRLAIRIVLYDNSMKEVKMVDLSEGQKIYGPIMTDLRQIGDKIYFIYHEIQEKNTIGNIMAVEINSKTLEVGIPKIIGNVNSTSLKLGFSENLQNEFKYFIVQSPDSKKYSFFMTDGRQQYFMSVLDENCNVLWSKNDKIDEYHSFNYQNVCIDNSGNVYLAMHFNNRKVEEINTNNRVYVFRKNGNPIILNLQVKDGAINNFKVLASKKENSVLVAGFYACVPGYINGSFYGTISSETFKINFLNSYKFSDSLLTTFANDGWALTKKKEYGLCSSMDFRVLELDNGNIDLVSEIKLISGMNDPRPYQVAGDILNVGFLKTGPVYSHIPKYRRTYSASFGNTFYTIAHQDKVIVFYNDNLKNITNPLSLKPINADGNNSEVLATGVFDLKGNVDRQLIYDSKEDHYISIPETTKYLGLGKIMIPFVSSKTSIADSDKMKLCSIEIQ